MYGYFQLFSLTPEATHVPKKGANVERVVVGKLRERERALCKNEVKVAYGILVAI